jgi:hypothetical protein
MQDGNSQRGSSVRGFCNAALGLAAFFAPTAAAQGWETATSGRVVIAVGGADIAASVRAAGFVDFIRTADSGLQAGFSLGAAVVSDDTDRFQLGQVGRVRAPITGLGGTGAGVETKAALVSGYGFVRGGWAEASLGRDQGAAERFSLPLPSAFAGLNVADAALDPGGRAAIRLVNAPSGAAAKAAVASVRLLGVAAGASYAPRQDRDDLSQGLGPGRARLDDIWEAGLSFARTSREGLKLEASLPHARADAAANGVGFGDLKSSGAALRLGRGPWTLGLAGLSTNNGRDDDRDYSAFGASGAWTFGHWTAMAGAARADDSWTGARHERAMLGMSRIVANRAKLGLAATADTRDVNGPLGRGRRQGLGLLAEISVEL